jgi:hypothetical protein
MNLLQMATFQARKKGVDRLTMAILKQTNAKRLNESVSPKVNPFILDPDQVFMAPQQIARPDPPGSANNRSQRRHKKGPSVAEVLTTG